MTAIPSARPSWRSKWFWVAVYWVVQALVICMGWAVFLMDEKRPRSWDQFLERLEDFLTADGAVFAAVIVGAVTLMQAVLLLPVRRPGMASSSVGVRILHCGLSSLTIAAITWLLMWPLLGMVEAIGIAQMPYIESVLSYSVPAAVAVVAFALLWSRRHAGVPVRVSVTIAALGAALLAAALFGAIASLIDLIAGKEHDLTGYLMIPGGFLSWIVFTPLLMAFCRKHRVESALSRFAAKLFLGTIIEAAAIIPLDVMVRRKTSCYCGTGTFWALTFCWGVGMLALGPAVFLLPISGRRKRWYAGLCDVCDYDMSGCMGAERCPECGAGWKGEQVNG